jgi:hypothetical protein
LLLGYPACRFGPQPSVLERLDSFPKRVFFQKQPRFLANQTFMDQSYRSLWWGHVFLFSGLKHRHVESGYSFNDWILIRL